MPSIIQGWREQYDRMVRAKDRLIGLAAGALQIDPPEARDTVIHFFQDAYHLKDWIKNDPRAATSDVEAFINSKTELRICADICNGTKHFSLRRTRTDDLDTALVSQEIRVTVGKPTIRVWAIESGGEKYLAYDLANQIVAHWDNWLVDEGLLS